MSELANDQTPPKGDSVKPTPAEPTLEEKLAGVVTPDPSPSNDDRVVRLLEATEKRTKDLQRIISKLGEEKKALQEQVGATQDDTTYSPADDWEKALVKRLTENIRSQTRADSEALLAPYKNQQATQEVAGGSDLARELLSDKTTVAWLKDQAADEEAMANLSSNKSALLMKAALFDAAARKFKNQNDARRKAPPLLKKEEAGMVSPPSGDTGLPSTDTFEDKAKRGAVPKQEATARFMKLAKELGFS